MPQDSIRFNNFLDSYNFYSNSINFRIQSSKAIEKFKNVQSFQLNQLANGKYYFSQTRREILLLKYDMWSRWMIEIENLFIELSGNEVSNVVVRDDVNTILSLADKTVHKYNSIMLDEHQENFDNHFTKIWLELHDIIYKYMVDMIKGTEGYTYDVAFTLIVDILVQVMQHTLLEIYELDSFIFRRENNHSDCTDSNCDSTDLSDFVIIGDLSEKCLHLFNESLVRHRIEIYKKYFNVTKIYIKNCTDDDIHKDVLEDLEKSGVEIDFKKSLLGK